MSDKLVFDLAQEVEGSPNVFIRKDWLNILDNQNQNYNNNQSVLDTSQLSNSNKYMSYREAYFSIPFLISFQPMGYSNNGGPADGGAGTAAYFDPTNPALSADYSVGLKNWFGQIIHSFTLDYNGTTIIQQTPFVNMWNSFKLMTSFSLNDIETQGATIGFYPDNPLTWGFINVNTAGLPANSGGGASLSGQGTVNNSNWIENAGPIVESALNSYLCGNGNTGFINRQYLINFDGAGSIQPLGDAPTVNASASTYNNLLYTNVDTGCRAVWKSYISNKTQGTTRSGSTAGLIQFSIVATVYLKHVHSFFNMCPLLKGVFMKMTMNLNNTSVSVAAAGMNPTNGADIIQSKSLSLLSVQNPLGGVNPLMVASAVPQNGNATLPFPSGNTTQVYGRAYIEYRANLSVGATCLDSTMTAATQSQGSLSKSIYLYIPAYTFNPVFEQAYLSSPVKQIKYTDIYQYQVLNVSPNGMINNLLTNGIANVKSILVLPFFSTNSSATPSVTSLYTGGSLSTNTGISAGTPVWQSPFDPAGTGPTSPCCWLTNFNVQVSGQNAIYNLEKYNFEQFNNQLYGQNAVNGGLTDGLTSSLINRQAFDMEYCYYYVNIERMLPVEQSVPKSIQLIGQNLSSKYIDYICFIEYGNSIDLDILTGARV